MLAKHRGRGITENVAYRYKHPGYYKENVSVDWAHRDSAHARMRVLVKRILRKYGYPPDLRDAAVQTVLAQAEALSAGWSMSRGNVR